MDVIYTCRSGDNEELRYSIRSVLKNAKFVNKIWVVGDKPDWYSGNFIKVAPVGNSFANVRNNLRKVIDHPDISEDFILMNDDFFIIENVNSVSHYYGGLLADRSLRHQELAGPNYYANMLMKTHRGLTQQGIKNPLNYELHVPMLFNKAKLADTIEKPFSIRSYYGNKYNLGGEDINDVKIYSHPRFKVSSSSMNNGTPFVSTDDESFSYVRLELEKMFPSKSAYELY